jgi:hypothetical protein
LARHQFAPHGFVETTSLFEPLLRAQALDPKLARVAIKELPWLEGRAAAQHSRCHAGVPGVPLA